MATFEYQMRAMNGSVSRGTVAATSASAAAAMLKKNGHITLRA